jgi:hypothetical protein
MNNIYKEQYLKHHNNFIDQLKLIFPSEETKKILDNISQSSDESKLTRAQLFSSSISGDNLDMFVKNKIKVFSHKNPDTQIISESLFGTEFCIKNLLNNQPEEVKKIIWTDLHTLCMIGEMLNSENVDENKVKILNQTIMKTRKSTELPELPNKSNTGIKNKLEDMLGVNVNNETKTMIDDIVESFEKVLTGQSSGNPLSGIMEISQMISVKYADKINKGDIELDKLMESITKKVPGMDQMMSGMMAGNTKKTPPKEKIIIDENFSTANIQVGLNKEEESKSFDIGGILKMVDKFGVIPGGKSCDDTSGIPGISKIMELMQKLDKAETNEDTEALKLEMDTFLQKELGIDVTQLNNQLDQVTQQMKEAHEAQ